MKRMFVLLVAICLMLSLVNVSIAENSFAEKLAEVGSSVEYAPYTVRTLAEGIYHIQDCVAAYPAGFWAEPDETGATMNNTAEMYLVVGEEKALLIDLSNKITRDNADQVLPEICNTLADDRPMEIIITHGHGDHVGMAYAFPGVNVFFPEGDYAASMGENYGLTEDRVTLFTPGEFKIDLGGRVMDTLKVSGHTAYSTLLFLEGENIIFSGDAIGSGMGVWIWGVDGMANLDIGMDALMAYLKANYTEEELEGLQFYGGHDWQYGSFTDDPDAVTFLDWQYVQDMAICIKLAKDGAWFDANSGMVLSQWAAPIGVLNCDLIYGTAGISVDYAVACEYAGYTADGVKLGK